MRTRTVRTIAVVASIAMILGAFIAAPADAKKKKKKAPAVCAAYTPGEKGAGKPIAVVTDAATADKPVEVTVSTQAGLGTSSEEGEGNDDGMTTHDYTNIQVDSAKPSAGLYLSVEFPPYYDYDLFLRDSYGTSLEYSAGFGVVPGGTDRSQNDFGAETINGYPAPDCSGYLVDISNATTPGGDVTVKFWLGDPT